VHDDDDLPACIDLMVMRTS